ncbi:MAG: iron ABC transporter permease [Planctomycetes bacterium]|nr:iron ABC transporter permease [Planctomycetota bacterium]
MHSTPVSSKVLSALAASRRAAAAALALIAPAASALLAGLALAVPLILIVQTFFDGGRADVSAWRNAFGDLDRWADLLSSTGQAVAVAVAASTAGGIALGAILFRTDARLRRPSIALLLLAAVIPFTTQASAILDTLGVARMQGSALGLGLIHGLAYIPVSALIAGIALRAADPRLEEAALVDGSTQMGVFLRITLRQASPGILAAALLTAIWTATDYSISDIILVRTFAEEVYTQFTLHSRPQEPTLVCLPIALLLGGLLAVPARWLLKRASAPSASIPAPPRPFRTGAWRLPLSLMGALSGLAFTVAPALHMARRLSPGKGLGHYLAVFAPEIEVSLATAFAAAAVAAPAATGLAWILVRSARWRGVVGLGLVILLALPAPLLGVGLIQIFNRPGLPGAIYDSPAMLVIAHATRFLPAAVILLAAAIRTIPRRLEEQARADGCSTFGVWRHVVLPLAAPSVLLAMLVVAALAAGELPCSLLVTPPGYTTMGARFFSLLHYGLVGDAAALSLISALAVGGIWAIMGLVWGAPRLLAGKRSARQRG